MLLTGSEWIGLDMCLVGLNLQETVGNDYD